MNPRRAFPFALPLSSQHSPPLLSNAIIVSLGILLLPVTVGLGKRCQSVPDSARQTFAERAWERLLIFCTTIHIGDVKALGFLFTRYTLAS